MSDKRLELAYDAALHILESQDATLSNIRSRASNLLAVAALVTSFAAGLGLINTDRSKGVVLAPVAAWVLLVILVSIGSLVIFVLWPIRVWHFGPSPSEIIERQRQGEQEERIRDYMITKMIDGIQVNGKSLKRKQNAFRWSVAFLVVEVTALVIALSASS